MHRPKTSTFLRKAGTWNLHQPPPPPIDYTKFKNLIKNLKTDQFKFTLTNRDLDSDEITYLLKNNKIQIHSRNIHLFPQLTNTTTFPFMDRQLIWTKICCLNINNWDINKHSIIEAIRQENPEIVLLQDHSQTNSTKLKLWNYTSLFNKTILMNCTMGL